ncbi:MAG TPA: STAS domain-containing protein [Bacteroidales bacterium]|nr:STAS domain-containing protein [Bacteroidales bacterium]
MINIEKKDKIDIVSFPTNKINALITDEIRDEINKLSETSNSKIIVDLQGVEYIDSSGFSCFLSAMRTVRNNYGIIKFANPDPKVMELLKMLHLNTVFQIFDDLDECIRSFR